ncbi:MFS transporter [Natrinema thermotolerans]|uniref:MFS transporter n=1 Tax=Natrinema thermotolerans TaxID=121872 RepID=A0AAF0T068_9EURY|nr:MFS transporter [Natrinema thermotolerans]QCC59495.1 MFS transporter [Natrinema thermotolerans]WMT06468.1 MFS transporter [Natrinema thermotolerans]
MERSDWRTVLLVTTWQISASICYYTIFAATPFFRTAFGLSRFSVGVVVTALTLGYAVFLLPLGALTDRFGERTTLTLGLLGLATGALLVAGAPSYALLLAAVFVLGSLYGTAIPGTNKAVFDNIDPGRRNLAMGIKQVGVTGGSGISALLVTGLAGALFWQAGFLVAAAVGLLVAVAFYRLYASDGEGDEPGYPDFRKLLSNRAYRSLIVAGLFLGAALFTTTGYTVLYVEESVGASVAFGGVVLALVQLFGSVGRVLTGWLSDTLPGEPRVRIGSLLIAQSIGSAVMFVVVASTTSERGAAVAFSVLGFFVLGYTGVYYSVMATLVRADEMGGATAGGQLALTSGALVAPPAFGYLADTVGYRTSWLFLAAVVTIAAGFLVQVVRTEPTVTNPAAAGESD